MRFGGGVYLSKSVDIIPRRSQFFLPASPFFISTSNFWPWDAFWIFHMPLYPLDISINVLFREKVHLTTRTQHSWRQIQIQLIGRLSSIYCDHQPIIEVLRKHMQPRKHRSINIWTTKYNHKHSRMCTKLCKCCPFIGEEIYVLCESSKLFWLIVFHVSDIFRSLRFLQICCYVDLWCLTSLR